MVLRNTIKYPLMKKFTVSYNLWHEIYVWLAGAENSCIILFFFLLGRKGRGKKKGGGGGGKWDAFLCVPPIIYFFTFYC